MLNANTTPQYSCMFSRRYGYPPQIVSLDNNNKNVYVFSPINNYLQVLDYSGNVIDYVDIAHQSNSQFNNNIYQDTTNNTTNKKPNYFNKHIHKVNQQLIAVWNQQSTKIVKDIKKIHFQDQFKVFQIKNNKQKNLTNLIQVKENMFCYFTKDNTQNFNHQEVHQKVRINFLQLNSEIENQNQGKKMSKSEKMIDIEQQNPEQQYNDQASSPYKKKQLINHSSNQDSDIFKQKLTSSEIQIPFQISLLQNCQLHLLQNQSSERILTILNQHQYTHAQAQVEEDINFNHRQSSIGLAIYDIQKQYFQSHQITSRQNNRQTLKYQNFKKAIQLSPNLISIYGKFNQIILYDLRNCRLTNYMKIMDNHFSYQQSHQNSICKKQNSFWSFYLNMGRNINQIDLRKPQTLIQTVIHSNSIVQKFVILNQKLAQSDCVHTSALCMIGNEVGKLSGYKKMKI